MSERASEGDAPPDGVNNSTHSLSRVHVTLCVSVCMCVCFVLAAGFAALQTGVE